MSFTSTGVLDEEVAEAKERLAELIGKYPGGGIRELSDRSLISPTQLRRYSKSEGEPTLSSLIGLQAALGRRAVEVRINYASRAFADDIVEAESPTNEAVVSSDINAQYRTIPVVSLKDCENPEVIRDAPKVKIDNRLLSMWGMGGESQLLHIIPGADVMAPTIGAKDTVIVDLRSTMPSDGIMLIYHAGDYSLRRLQINVDGTLRISTDNPLYQDLVVDSAAADFRVVGAVVGVEKRLR